MLKITGFSVITTADGKRLSYTLSELNEQGEVIRSNIRKSTSILNTDISELAAVSLLESYILGKEF